MKQPTRKLPRKVRSADAQGRGWVRGFEFGYQRALNELEQAEMARLNNMATYYTATRGY